MFEVEEGSIEHVLLKLQDVGLEINEHRIHLREVSLEDYENLLNHNIEVLQAFRDYHNNVNEFLNHLHYNQENQVASASKTVVNKEKKWYQFWKGDSRNV
ncbi:hypothetical protein D3C84_701310 [compost metagenome]